MASKRRWNENFYTFKGKPLRLLQKTATPVDKSKAAIDVDIIQQKGIHAWTLQPELYIQNSGSG